jgi:hypothetical protein
MVSLLRLGFPSRIRHNQKRRARLQLKHLQVDVLESSFYASVMTARCFSGTKVDSKYPRLNIPGPNTTRSPTSNRILVQWKKVKPIASGKCDIRLQFRQKHGETEPLRASRSMPYTAI